MSEPIVFISHHRIKEGKLEALRKYNQQGSPHLQEGKPGTIGFLTYTSEDGGEVSFLHVFPAAQAMDHHMQGASERAKSAYEFIQPQSFEVCGNPSNETLGAMKRTAAQSGADLHISADYLGGFLHLEGGD
jgi:quinol monooxygenase YgiN